MVCKQNSGRQGRQPNDTAAPNRRLARLGRLSYCREDKRFGIGGAWAHCCLLAAIAIGMLLGGAIAGVGTAAGAEQSASRNRLKVSDDGRWLVRADGSPFFYLGDTAWELFHRLNREEVDLYLRDRAQKGFTVIQAVVLAELDGLEAPNPYGDVPLVDRDPTKPNEAYFKHVDYVVSRAEALGIFIGMLPTWGDKWNKKWGKGPEIFTPENARVYGRWLGRRYKDRPIIWILGGDRPIENDRHREITRAMAAGLAEGDGGTHLMTFHPQGNASSAQWFHEEPWLSFNMFQSGHGSENYPNYKMTLSAYERKPTKPVLDGEPRYEDHPIDWKPDKGWFDQWDVRQAAYWSMLSGACGHTYGDHNIWQMWQPDRKPISAARTPWREALRHPGSGQMGLMRRLFESRPWQTLVPDQSLFVGENPGGADHCRAARAADGAFALIYAPTGKTMRIRVEKLQAEQVVPWWFNPRDGKFEALATITVGKVEGGAEQGAGVEFDPPGEPGRGNDWVLVLDSAAKAFGPPGQSVSRSAPARVGR